MKLPELDMAKKTQSRNKGCSFDHDVLPSLVILLLAGRTPALPDSSSDNASKIKKYFQKHLRDP
jgi:hypothetical protein